MLTIKNLSVSVGEKEILKDFNLTVNEKEVHAIMGPNGIGKSTICKTIMGDPNYIVTSGSIFYNDTDLLKLNVSERARLGIYLLNQSPIEIPGVSNAEMLRLRLNENNPNPISIFDFNKKMTSICEKLDIPNFLGIRGDELISVSGCFSGIHPDLTYCYFINDS